MDASLAPGEYRLIAARRRGGPQGENFRPGVMRAMGFDCERLRALNQAYGLYTTSPPSTRSARP
jgi:hypothetical protein